MSDQPVHEVARLIAAGGAYVDADAVRVAREYLLLARRHRPAFSAFLPSDSPGVPTERPTDKEAA